MPGLPPRHPNSPAHPLPSGSTAPAKRHSAGMACPPPASRPPGARCSPGSLEGSSPVDLLSCSPLLSSFSPAGPLMPLVMGHAWGQASPPSTPSSCSPCSSRAPSCCGSEPLTAPSSPASACSSRPPSRAHSTDGSGCSTSQCALDTPWPFQAPVYGPLTPYSSPLMDELPPPAPQQQQHEDAALCKAASPSAACALQAPAAGTSAQRLPALCPCSPSPHSTGCAPVGVWRRTRSRLSASSSCAPCAIPADVPLAQLVSTMPPGCWEHAVWARAPPPALAPQLRELPVPAPLPQRRPVSWDADVPLSQLVGAMDQGVEAQERMAPSEAPSAQSDLEGMSPPQQQQQQGGQEEEEEELEGLCDPAQAPLALPLPQQQRQQQHQEGPLTPAPPAQRAPASILQLLLSWWVW